MVLSFVNAGGNVIDLTNIKNEILNLIHSKVLY